MLPIGEYKTYLPLKCLYFVSYTATPPNAIVFASGSIRVIDMVSERHMINRLSKIFTFRLKLV